MFPTLQGGTKWSSDPYTVYGNRDVTKQSNDPYTVYGNRDGRN